MTLMVTTALMTAAFAAIHLFIGRLRFLDVMPRSRWLSFAGGVAVAYVFLHVLPELGVHEETFAHALELDPATAEGLVYLVALMGLAGFYGLEGALMSARRRSRTSGAQARIEGEIFWLHMGAFGLYNVLIGYLLYHREQAGWWSLAIYFIAMALHFITADFGLRRDHRTRYDRHGRWLTAAAVWAGWLAGTAITVSELALGLLFAFLAGGIVLNVLKEELPEERQSRFAPFLAGALSFAGLLLAGSWLGHQGL